MPESSHARSPEPIVRAYWGAPSVFSVCHLLILSILSVALPEARGPSAEKPNGHARVKGSSSPLSIPAFWNSKFHAQKCAHRRGDIYFRGRAGKGQRILCSRLPETLPRVSLFSQKKKDPKGVVTAVIFFFSFIPYAI